MFRPARKAGRRRIPSIHRRRRKLTVRHVFSRFVQWYLSAFLCWQQTPPWFITNKQRNRQMHAAHGNGAPKQGPKGRGRKASSKGDPRNHAVNEDPADDQLELAEQIRLALHPAAVLRAQSYLLQEDWNVACKTPQMLDSNGGVALTNKQHLPEIIRRIGWTSHPSAVLLVQQPSELGLYGCPRQKVQCRISVMTDTAERKVVTVDRWLVQLGFGPPVVQKMHGDLVSIFVTMKSCIARFSPRFGWPVGPITASIATEEITKHVPQPAIADVTPREAQSVAFMVHADYCKALLRSSGISGVFFKYRKDPEANEMPLLWLDEETPFETALEYAKGPEVLGVVEKSSASEGRFALRFEDLATLEAFAKTKNIQNNSMFGRWKVSGTPSEMGLAGAAAFLASQQWQDFDILYVDPTHFVFISPMVGNHQPMHFVYQGVSRQIFWKAVNAKARSMVKTQSMAASSAAKVAIQGPLSQGCA
eukprot:Skav233620  [mRNA]  locus=scaffold109:307050:308477:+ [translate_table: standard]